MTKTRWSAAAGARPRDARPDASPAAGTAAAPFELQREGSHRIIGNTLAERMQYDGWLETMLHARFPKHELVDPQSRVQRRRDRHAPALEELRHARRVAQRPRRRRSAATRRTASTGTNTKADVIFAFFGYNESYAGQAGLDAFKKQLGDWITHTLAQKYNGKIGAAARRVLADRARGSRQSRPARRQGEQHQRLALYTRAMAEVAKAQRRDVRRSLRAEP